MPAIDDAFTHLRARETKFCCPESYSYLRVVVELLILLIGAFLELVKGIYSTC